MKIQGFVKGPKIAVKDSILIRQLKNVLQIIKILTHYALQENHIGTKLLIPVINVLKKNLFMTH